MKNKSHKTLLLFRTRRHMPLELVSKWSEFFDVLLLMKHFMVEVVPNLGDSYSPTSSVSLQRVSVVNGGWPQLVVM